jgi:endoglucanase
MKKTVSLFIGCSLIYSINVLANTAYVSISDTTPMQFVADMGVGWNLGNSLDAETRKETGWGNPLTSKAMIDEVRKKGFKTLRIPVTWRFHIGDAPHYTIEKAWLDRVEEVANYGFANNMYVIINIHHDDPWIIPNYVNLDEVKDKLGKLWTQIANRFKDYGDYLIFETLNEPRSEGSPTEWTGTAEEYDCVNKYHQVCVDAIRATGANNATRYVMISTYAAKSLEDPMDALIIPNDDKMAIVSIHSYFPNNFCLNDENDSTWGSNSDKKALDDELDQIYNKFVLNGRAVVLGEWGTWNKNNASDRLAYAKQFSRKCIENGFCPILWDNGDAYSMGIFNRRTLKWSFPEIVDAIIEAGNVPVISKYPIAQKNKQLFVYTSKNNSEINFNYTLDKTSDVSIKIVNLAGKHIRTLLPSQKQSAGNHNFIWNRKNDQGGFVSNCIYFIVFTINNRRYLQKNVF